MCIINVACCYDLASTNIKTMLKSNLLFPLEFLCYAEEHRIPLFINLTTALFEKFNTYSFTKHKFSEFGEYFFNKNRKKFLDLKLVSFYGHDEPATRFIPNCIFKMKHNEDINLTGGIQRRDFIHVEDIINIIIFLLNKKDDLHEGYTEIPIGTGEAPTIKEIVEYIKDTMKSNSILNFGAIQMRTNEPDCIANISKLTNLGYKIKYSWKSGLKEIIKGIRIMKILINGGCGFLGSNLAKYGIDNGYDITILDNLSKADVTQNLTWLKQSGQVKFIWADTRNRNDIEKIIKSGKFDSVFHLAGQVAMTTSLSNPYMDFETNTIGTLNLLESIRLYSPETSIFFSSTNKVYGDLESFNYDELEKKYICREHPNGFDESIPLEFRSPYGCSKGAADQYMLDYHKMFGIKTTVFRHSSMYGSRQFSTFDQGWIGWFCQKAIEKYNNPSCTPFTIAGNGKQVRDILHSEDMIRLYYSALDNVDTVCGEAYNIGGSIEQSLSLLELFDMLNEIVGITLEYKHTPPRISDQKVFVADIKKIQKKINWTPQVTAKVGIEDILKVGTRKK